MVLVFTPEDREKSIPITTQTINHINIEQVGSFVQHAENSSVTGSVISTLNLNEAAEEFADLRKTLLERAQSPEDYAAIGVIASAEIEAKSGEESKMKRILSTLGQAGNWALDVAKETGALVAAELIKSQIS